MLSRYVQTEEGRRRYLSSPIGPCLDGFASWLEERGFAAATIYSDLKTAAVFGEFLVDRRVAEPQGIAGGEIGDFLEWYLATPRKSGPARKTPEGSVSLREKLLGSIRKLFVYLRATGAMAPPPPAEPSRTPYHAVTGEYLDFLVRHRGFAPSTVYIHRSWTQRFFAGLSRRKPPVDLAALTASDVEDVFLEISNGLGRRSQQIMTSAVGALLRYLRVAGHIPDACRPFLPRRRTYTLAALPTAVPWEEVQRALESIDRSTPMGKRDYAIFLLLSTYGMRSGELVELSLDDIDWRRGRLEVHQPKTLRFLELPLVAPVAEALLDYLRHARPQTEERKVFLKCHAPSGPITRVVVYWAVRNAFLRAGVKTEHYGPHALRHALATTLFRHGRPIKVVGDLLGHRLPEATLLYCKLAIEDLRGAALELPRGES